MTKKIDKETGSKVLPPNYPHIEAIYLGGGKSLFKDLSLYGWEGLQMLPGHPTPVPDMNFVLRVCSKTRRCFIPKTKKNVEHFNKLCNPSEGVEKAMHMEYDKNGFA